MRSMRTRSDHAHRRRQNSDEEYEELIDWIQANPLSLDANYQRVQTAAVCTTHSTLCYRHRRHQPADYIIAEPFFANTDWRSTIAISGGRTQPDHHCGTVGDTRWAGCSTISTLPGGGCRLQHVRLSLIQQDDRRQRTGFLINSSGRTGPSATTS
jgi:hypothetical protein